MKLIGFTAVALLVSAVSLNTTPARADCRTVYSTVCADYDDKGRCKRFEREEREVCTERNSAPHVSPPTNWCYDCTSYNNDGSCRTTRRYQC